MNELALFAGAGGGILGGLLCGFRTVCAVENNPYARDVLVARQNDGCLYPFPIWDDVCTFDGRPWRGIVDVVSGGFPCQDISAAGKGAGITGARSGLWCHMARIISEVRPRFVIVENSPLLVRRGLAVVLGDLAALGYDARWGVLGAHNAGAPHKRDRIWVVAHTDNERSRRRKQQQEGSEGAWYVANTDSLHEQGVKPGVIGQKEREEQGERPSRPRCDGSKWWETEPDVGRVADELAARLDRLRCIGNGQVPAVVQLAWDLLN